VRGRKNRGWEQEALSENYSFSNLGSGALSGLMLDLGLLK